MTQKPGNDETIARPAATRPDSGRRRFIIAGLAAAPVIMTLAARPAFAQEAAGTTYGYAEATFDEISSFSGSTTTGDTGTDWPP